jgi:septal ring factor EnvC (AmiA/AmiB activator)
VERERERIGAKREQKRERERSRRLIISWKVRKRENNPVAVTSRQGDSLVAQRAEERLRLFLVTGSHI